VRLTFDSGGLTLKVPGAASNDEGGHTAQSPQFGAAKAIAVLKTDVSRFTLSAL